MGGAGNGAVGVQRAGSGGAWGGSGGSHERSLPHSRLRRRLSRFLPLRPGPRGEEPPRRFLFPSPAVTRPGASGREGKKHCGCGHGRPGRLGRRFPPGAADPLRSPGPRHGRHPPPGPGGLGQRPEGRRGCGGPPGRRGHHADPRPAGRTPRPGRPPGLLPAGAGAPGAAGRLPPPQLPQPGAVGSPGLPGAGEAGQLHQAAGGPGEVRLPGAGGGRGKPGRSSPAAPQGLPADAEALLRGAHQGGPGLAHGQAAVPGPLQLGRGAGAGPERGGRGAGPERAGHHQGFPGLGPGDGQAPVQPVPGQAGGGAHPAEEGPRRGAGGPEGREPEEDPGAVPGLRHGGAGRGACHHPLGTGGALADPAGRGGAGGGRLGQVGTGERSEGGGLRGARGSTHGGDGHHPESHGLRPPYRAWPVSVGLAGSGVDGGGRGAAGSVPLRLLPADGLGALPPRPEPARPGRQRGREAVLLCQDQGGRGRPARPRARPRGGDPEQLCGCPPEGRRGLPKGLPRLQPSPRGLRPAGPPGGPGERRPSFEEGGPGEGHPRGLGPPGEEDEQGADEGRLGQDPEELPVLGRETWPGCGHQPHRHSLGFLHPAGPGRGVLGPGGQSHREAGRAAPGRDPEPLGQAARPGAGAEADHEASALLLPNVELGALLGPRGRGAARDLPGGHLQGADAGPGRDDGGRRADAAPSLCQGVGGGAVCRVCPPPALRCSHLWDGAQGCLYRDPSPSAEIQPPLGCCAGAVYIGIPPPALRCSHLWVAVRGLFI